MKHLYYAPQGAAKALDLGIRSSPRAVARYSYSTALVARADELQQLGDFWFLSFFSNRQIPYPGYSAGVAEFTQLIFNSSAVRYCAYSLRKNEN